MKIKNIKPAQKGILFVGACLLSSVGWGATNNYIIHASNTDTQPPIVKQHKVKHHKSKHHRHHHSVKMAQIATNDTNKSVQTFKSHDLSVQFRYQSGKLLGIRLLNVGKQALDIDILKKTYTLGANDSIVITPPNVPQLEIFYTPHTIFSTLIDKIFPNRYSYREIFIMPSGEKGARLTS